MRDAKKDPSRRGLARLGTTALRETGQAPSLHGFFRCPLQALTVEVIVFQMSIAMPMSISISIERTLAAWMIAGSRVTGLLVLAPFLRSAAGPPRSCSPARAHRAFARRIRHRVPPRIHPPTHLRSRTDCRPGVRRPDGVFARQHRQSRQQPGRLRRALPLLRTDCAPALYSAWRPTLAVARTRPQLRLHTARPFFPYLAGGARAFRIRCRDVCGRCADRRAGRGRELVRRRRARFYRQSIAAIASPVCRDLDQKPAGLGAVVRRDCVLAALL